MLVCLTEPHGRAARGNFTSRWGEKDPVLRLQLLRVPRCWWPKQTPST